MTFELDRGGRFRDRAAGWALRTAFVAFTAAVAVTVAACGNAATSPTAAGELSGGGGMLRGEISRFIVDREDGTSEVQYFIRTAAGAERRLYFARDPDLAPYAPVEIRGRAAAGDAVTVSSFRLLDTATPTAETRGLVAPKPKTPRRFAFVLIDTGEGVNLSAETARERMFDAGHFVPNQGSIRRYYQEASFGVEDITGDVYGPIRFTPTVACDTRGVTTLRPQIDAMAGGPIDHYMWYFGSRQAGCNFSGLASQGSPDRPARDTWYNAASGCVVLVQEPGHNFGMQHSSSMTCPDGKAFVDEPEGACVHAEYGDSFDPMGSGCRHMNGWQKTYEGWMDGCNSVKITSSGTFTLFPIETACNGIQVMQIPMPRERRFSHTGGGGAPAVDVLTSYYLELRTSVGFDQGVAPMVLVRVAGDLRSGKRSGLHTWLLDMTPSTSSFRDAGLPVGGTFTDPAGGVSITVVSANAAQASVAVHLAAETGPPTCLDGTLVTPPGPTSCEDGTPGGGRGQGGAAGAGGGASGQDPAGARASAESGCGCGLGARLGSRTALALAAITVAAGLVLGRRRLGRRRRGPTTAVAPAGDGGLTRTPPPPRAKGAPGRNRA